MEKLMQKYVNVIAYRRIGYSICWGRGGEYGFRNDKETLVVNIITYPLNICGIPVPFRRRRGKEGSSLGTSQAVCGPVLHGRLQATHHFVEIYLAELFRILDTCKGITYLMFQRLRNLNRQRFCHVSLSART